MSVQPKNILVLARNDHLEAMRVAAGMTIFGHAVSLVFMHHSLSEQEAGSEQAELLELAEIVPTTTVEEMKKHFALLSTGTLASEIERAEVILSV